MQRRVNWEKGLDLKTFARAIFVRATNKGNLGLARNVCQAVNDLARDDEATTEMFMEALRLKGGLK